MRLSAQAEGEKGARIKGTNRVAPLVSRREDETKEDRLASEDYTATKKGSKSASIPFERPEREYPPKATKGPQSVHSS